MLLGEKHLLLVCFIWQTMGSFDIVNAEAQNPTNTNGTAEVQKSNVTLPSTANGTAEVQKPNATLPSNANGTAEAPKPTVAVPSNTSSIPENSTTVGASNATTGVTAAPSGNVSSPTVETNKTSLGDMANATAAPSNSSLTTVSKLNVTTAKVCEGVCPSQYKLNAECLCALDPHEGEECLEKKTCGEGFVPNNDCDCVRKLRPPVEKCNKTCPSIYVLDTEQCRCTCQSKCSDNFEVDSSTCNCVCNLVCREGLVLNKVRCACEKLVCPKGRISHGGKCIEALDMLCPEGKLFIDSECVESEFCPPGFEKLPNRLCKRKCCHGPCSRDQKRCGPESCGENKYMINGECKHVVESPCPDRSFFDFLKPSCPRTCEEPVLLTTCKARWSGPGCSCFPGFVYHEGHCIHPNSCPNKHLCIRHGDVAFLLDSSEAVGNRDFELMKAFTRSLMFQMNLDGGNCHRIFVARFATEMTPVLELGSYRSLKKHEMLDKVASMRGGEGASQLGEVLRHFRNVHFTAEKGLRENVPRVVILMTDGGLLSGNVDANHEARLIREAGIQLLIVKVGGIALEEVRRVEHLAGIAGRDSVYGLRDFRDIKPLSSRIISFRCKEFNCPTPRLIPGACHKEFSEFDRMEFVKGEFHCEPRLVKNVERHRCACPEPLVNVSNCVNNFKTVNKTVFVFDNKTEECKPQDHQDHVRCGCNEPKTEYGPCEGTQREVSYVTETLESTNDSQFICKRNVTQSFETCGCPPPLIQSGNCSDKETRVANITSYRFLYTNKSCIAQTREVILRCTCPPPSVDTHICTENNIEVKVLIHRLSPSNECLNDTFLGAVPCKRICPQKMDIGIIVDTSAAVSQEDFKAIKAFLKQLIDKFNVNLDGVRVSLLTYASPKSISVISSFITFNHGNQVKERIDALEITGGNASIAEALRTYRKLSLLKSQGSRIQEKVAQMLYLITDGTADSSAEEESKQLQDLEVKVSVISVGKRVKVHSAAKLVSQPVEHNMVQVNVSDLEDIVEQVHDLRCFMENGTDDITIRDEYAMKLAGRHKILLTTRLENLTDSHEFKSLRRIDVGTLARVFLKFHGTFDFLHRGKEEKFIHRVRAAIANQTGVPVFLVTHLEFAAGDESNRTKVSFQIPTQQADIFAGLIRNRTFLVYDMAARRVEYDLDVVVISSDTVNAVQATEDLDTQARIVFKVLKMYVVNDKLLETLMKRLHYIDDLYMQLRKLLRMDEERTVRLCYEILRQSLSVVRDCEWAVQNIDNEATREAALGHMDDSLKEVVDFTVRAMEKAGQAQKRFKVATTTAAPVTSPTVTTAAPTVNQTAKAN